MRPQSFQIVLFGLVCLASLGHAAELADAGSPFGMLPLVDEVLCDTAPDVESPVGASEVVEVFGEAFRVLPNVLDRPSYFGYRIGAEKGLKAGAAYVLCVEYPEDRGRSFHIANWGCETVLGLATGDTVGDVLQGRYTNHNAESVHYPLSGSVKTWRQLFFLHDRFPALKRPRGQGLREALPEDGFLVIFAQPESKMAPLSGGAAVKRIRLFEVPDPSKFDVKLNLPPEDLPRRHIFWREEMADGVISIGHSETEKDPALRGVTNRLDWFTYKAKLMKFMGMDTYCKDLLEFGHNQGWDSTPEEGGRNDWINQAADPEMWGELVELMGSYGFNLLPYYEYAGSIGSGSQALGSERRSVTLAGKQDYTHISWVHHGNADIADPDFIADAAKVLDYTITRYKDQANFVGAWFRPRPEANPISFNDKDLARFTREANDGTAVTRETLRNDTTLLNQYYAWWFEKRKEFLDALADGLRERVNPDAVLLYTTDSSEPGVSLPRALTGKGQSEWWNWKTVVVAEDVALWREMLGTPRFAEDERFNMFRAVDYMMVVDEEIYRVALTYPKEDYGEYEWRHASPEADPQRYQGSDKVLLTYSFNRMYTVSCPEAFDDFRTRAGLAITRHYPLNENEMNLGDEELLGYFVSDVERAGPYCMAAEVLAMANGDPRYIAYLTGNSYNRGFPEYVRAFNAAFLALPALPSKRITDAADDNVVVVRTIETEQHGTYLAVMNTSFETKTDMAIRLPKAGEVEDLVTGERMIVNAESGLRLDLGACQLRALRISGLSN